MSAFGGSQERRPHRIGGCGGAGPDCGSGLDSATSGELAAVARGELADQLRAAGRADTAVEAVFREVPRHAFSCLRWIKEDEIQPGSFKITPGLAKVEPAEEHRKARTMIDTLIRSASPNGATDGQTSTAVGGGARPGSPGMRRRPRGRLWALLHAQALLSGPTTDVVGIEDDWKRMAGRRAR